MRLRRVFEAQAKATGILNLDFTGEGGDAHKVLLTADEFGDAGNELSAAVDFIDRLPASYHEASASGFSAFADIDVYLNPDENKFLRFASRNRGTAANGQRVIVRYDGNLADNTAAASLDGTTHILGINGTLTLLQLATAFNNAQEANWNMTAFPVERSQGGDTVVWSDDGVAASATGALGSATLTITAVAKNSSGNDIRVQIVGGGSGNSATVFLSLRTITVQIGGTRSLTQIAAAINANAQAASLVTAVASGSNSNRGRTFTQLLGLTTGNSGILALSGGLDGERPNPRQTELALGENAITGLTKYRFGQATLSVSQFIDVLNAIPAASKTMTASLAPGAVGNVPLNIAQRAGTAIAAREVARVRLAGGEHNPNVQETLEGETVGYPVELLCGGRLVYTVDMDWTNSGAGNVRLVLQKLLEDVGLPAADVWIDWDTDNHTIALNRPNNGNTVRVVRQLQDSAVIAGIYRFRAVATGNAVRGTVTVKIDERASTGINTNKSRDNLTVREGPI